MQRVVLASVLVVLGVFASACGSGHGSASSTTVITPNISACSAIDNQVLGRYRKLSVAEQNVAGQDLVDRATHASDPTIVAEAKQLQQAADRHDLSGMDRYLGELATRCDHLGLGPEQVSRLATPG